MAGTLLLVYILPFFVTARIEGTAFEVNGTTVDDHHVDYPRIWLFGDSLTQLGYSTDGCWATTVTNAFARKCDVVVRGFSGYNTRVGKHVLRRVFDRHDAALVAAFVIMLGTNDSPTPEHRGGTQVPLDEYAANLEEMLDYLNECDVAENKVILVTPPPLDEDMWSIVTRTPGRPTVSLSRVQKFAEACAEVGTKRRVHVLNSFSGLLAEANWRALFRDGVHFSAAGSRKFAQLLMPVLNKVVGNKQLVFPNFRTVTPSDPGREINAWNFDQKDTLPMYLH